MDDKIEFAADLQVVPATTEPIYTVENYPPEGSIAFLMNVLIARYVDELDLGLAGLDINAAQWGILMTIFEGRANTPSGLCRVRYHYSGAMTHILDRLEDKLLLRRKRCEHDRRVVELELTEEGVRVYRAGFPIIVATQNRLLAGMSREEHDFLHGLLQRMSANLSHPSSEP